jgi:HD superfamily phosphohydrolase
MSTKKIFNDPVYGFVSVPYGILFEIIEHPYFQRLRRIKQVSLTHYVYPGALHTRFHHALGAMHLMTQAIEVLRGKGVDITDEEATAVQVAILLHDVGHGPFSHTLENTLITAHHETLSLLFMERLNQEFDGQLDLAISIFKDTYQKPFLHQLISGQLDMDRMDYLNRDSFFTGVHEGVIGYDRMIKMLAVHSGDLVVEEKGIYSVEKFLMARRLMYWQVYLHKTVLSAEQMLISVLRRARELFRQGVTLRVSENLAFFLSQDVTEEDFFDNKKEVLDRFAALDDYDIVAALKSFFSAEDPILRYLARCIINRKLFRLELQNEPFEQEYVDAIREEVSKQFDVAGVDLKYLLLQGAETNRAYSTANAKEEIKILFKSGEVKTMSASSDINMPSQVITKHFLAYPKSCRVKTL